MSSPAMRVEIAFGDPPLTANVAATWVDVSDFVEGKPGTQHYIRRGRNHERDEIEAGTAIVVLNNKDRRFDPNNATSPYLGDIKPMTKIRIGGEWLGNDYWLFYGYIESWTPEYYGGTVSTCTIECVDAFKMLGLVDVHTSGNRPQELSGDRIGNAADGHSVLDAVGWPAGERSIAAGDIDVAEIPLDASALSIIQQTAQAERGTFYISRLGTATFEDRSFRDTATPIDVWGSDPAGTELPYASLTTRIDDSDIWNQIYASAIGGIAQVAFDTTSQADYFVRTLTLPELPYVDDTEALAAAQYMLARYSEPHVRHEKLVIDPGVRDEWHIHLSRELSDLITINRTTLYAGATATFDQHIEAIEWVIEKGKWIVTWSLTPHFTVSPLAGSLVTADTWKVPTLQNSWVDYGAGRPPAGYRREGAWVYLRGAVKNGATAGSRIMTLPVGYRPPYDHVQTVMSGTTNPTPPPTELRDAAQLLIQTDGDVFCVGGGNASVDFSGVLFRVI